MPAFDTLLYTKDAGVARIALNRPRVRNAFNLQMRDDFAEVLSAVADDPEVRAVMITGEGRAFCAGADLTEFGTAPSLVKAREVRWERDVWGQLRSLSRPIVTAVHGYCIGSGLEIALFSDIRIAAAGTVFAMPEVQLGMIPAAGGTQTLARSVGPAVALDLLLTGRRFDAKEALRLRLITRMVPEESLVATAGQVAHLLAQVDPNRMAGALDALKLGVDLGLDQALPREARIAELALGQ
ncbi:MAG TPA: enoyl-CoA hydratase/isomerase family protein [Dehalococcoidia bacterium]|nr:enoyl-CoA hydratase/isomerase family protein [Dehalococcoidia bacterium]